MRYFFDTEFIDNGKTIDLISIGIVDEVGRTYYAESNEYDPADACPWVQENVIKYLEGDAKPRVQIRDEIISFIGDNVPKFWAYYGAYDWVVFSQLFGTMLSLPKGWPQFYFDIKALSVLMGNFRFPEQATRKHNALNDAIWTQDSYDALFLQLATLR